MVSSKHALTFDVYILYYGSPNGRQSPSSRSVLHLSCGPGFHRVNPTITTSTTTNISPTPATAAGFVVKPPKHKTAFLTLGGRYSLRIVPGQNSLLLPNNISRSTAVGTIYTSDDPLAHLGGGACVDDADYDGYWSSVTIGGIAGRTSSSIGGRVSSVADCTLVLVIGGDEKLLRRLNEWEDAETMSTSRRGTDAKWKLDPGRTGRKRVTMVRI